MGVLYIQRSSAIVQHMQGQGNEAMAAAWKLRIASRINITTNQLSAIFHARGVLHSASIHESTEGLRAQPLVYVQSVQSIHIRYTEQHSVAFSPAVPAIKPCIHRSVFGGPP